MNLEVVLDVTQEDVEQGVPINPYCCPLAMATKRAVPEATDVVVTNRVRFTLRGHEYVASLTDEAFEFRTSFDCNIDVAPARFPLIFERV